MILSRRAALGGSQLDQVDSSVVIRGMDPGTTKKTVNTVSQMGGSGQRETGSHWETVEASVTYAIDIPKTNLADRREVFDSVNEWALAKGWLTMNWMDGGIYDRLHGAVGAVLAGLGGYHGDRRPDHGAGDG